MLPKFHMAIFFMFESYESIIDCARTRMTGHRKERDKRDSYIIINHYKKEHKDIKKMTDTCGNNQLCHTSKKLIWQLSTTQDVPAIPTPGQVKVTSQLKYCNTQTETPHSGNTINVNTQTELTCYIVWIICPGLFKFIYS